MRAHLTLRFASALLVALIFTASTAHAAPTTMPEPIMIIPKRLLNKPLKPADKSVADAR